MTVEKTNSLATAPKRVCILILGAHRSGTSALTGLLTHFGCDGPLSPMQGNIENKKGYFESRRVYELHNQLLPLANSCWDDWRPIDPGWLESPAAMRMHDKAVATLKEEFTDSRLFVLKDPRICRLAPFWLQALRQLDCTPLVVHTHRNPLEVAMSLNKRDEFAPEFGLLLWLRHIMDAENATRGMRRFFTSYRHLMLDWADMIAGMQANLAFDFPCSAGQVSGEVNAFLSHKLQHFHQSPEDIATNPAMFDWVRTVFEIVERWADAGEDREDYTSLDQIRAQLDAVAPVFGRLIKLGRAATVEVKQKSAALEKSTARIEDLQSDLSSLQKEFAQEKEARLQAKARLLDQQTEIGEISARFGGAKSQVKQLQNSLAQETKRAEAAEYEYNRVLNSTSWRLTSPLRRLVHMTRGQIAD